MLTASVVLLLLPVVAAALGTCAEAEQVDLILHRPRSREALEAELEFVCSAQSATGDAGQQSAAAARVVGQTEPATVDVQLRRSSSISSGSSGGNGSELSSSHISNASSSTGGNGASGGSNVSSAVNGSSGGSNGDGSTAAAGAADEEGRQQCRQHTSHQLCWHTAKYPQGPA